MLVQVVQSSISQYVLQWRLQSNPLNHFLIRAWNFKVKFHLLYIHNVQCRGLHKTPSGLRQLSNFSSDHIFRVHIVLQNERRIIHIALKSNCRRNRHSNNTINNLPQSVWLVSRSVLSIASFHAWRMHWSFSEVLTDCRRKVPVHAGCFTFNHVQCLLQFSLAQELSSNF